MVAELLQVEFEPSMVETERHKLAAAERELDTVPGPLHCKQLGLGKRRLTVASSVAQLRCD